MLSCNVVLSDIVEDGEQWREVVVASVSVKITDDEDLTWPGLAKFWGISFPGGGALVSFRHSLASMKF